MADDPDHLFREQRHALMAVARRRLRDTQDSADAVQDVFLRYLSRGEAAAMPEVRNPPGFLRRMLANLLTNRQQRGRALLQGHEAEAALGRAADEAPGPEAALLSGEAAARLRRLVAELPPRGRQVIYLHKFKGLSYAEIGARLGISENTVMVHMSRSLATLRRRLADDEGGL
jgi:RNA polymerase sigma-70 factor (ECF subfamily)